MRHLLPLLTLVIVLTTLAPPARAESPAVIRTVRDLPYKEAGDDYQRQRCKLDLYLPVDKRDFPTVLWFHGGGLTSGDKSGQHEVALATSFAAQGIAVAVPNYRLSPKATYPAYVEDAAAAFAFISRTIAEHGGAPNRLFIAGHSAGGYLTAAIGYDPKFLAAHNLKTSSIAGLIPVSPQLFTHYTIREERGLKDARFTPVIDEAAPAFHARKDAPPTLLFIADDDMPTRREENEYFVALLRAVGHPDIACITVKERNHGTVGQRIAGRDDPARVAIDAFIQKHLAARPANP